MDLWSPPAMDERLYPLLETGRGSAIGARALRFIGVGGNGGTVHGLIADNRGP